MSTLVSNEKGSLAHSTSGSARVDLFFKTVRRISLESLHQLLENSWNEDPLDTLKLTFYNRDCRGGKGERQVFYESIKWIILNKGPEHLIANLDLLSDYGRWDDALWFLTPKKEKSTKRPAKKQKLDNEQEKKPEDAMVVDEAPEKVEPELTPEQKAIFDEVTEAVGQHFAKQLKADLEAMNSESKEKKVSLCAKWAPSENGKHDKKVGATKVICKALGINEATYRKTYLVPLRKYLHIIETPMCTEHFELIDYSKVPGVAMNKFKDIFSKKDAERFNQYKESLKKGETKVNAATVEPHEVVRQFMYQTPDQETILEEQWKVILERVRSLGTLSKCLVVSDVSGSMSGTPMEVSVALGIMIAQLTSGPFNNHLITFSSEPKLHKMVGNTLNEQVKDVMAMEWGMSTDFQKVFDLVLQKGSRQQPTSRRNARKDFCD
ncbi:developmentally-regulated protein with vWFA domain [Acrasis kona]|uniref:Developmentally-regulated protein with vWFA domain n=1 Tax=Acrasis kona TaxID=1008807 RepID=A0AAW2ZGB2_9EUKA